MCGSLRSLALPFSFFLTRSGDRIFYRLRYPMHCASHYAGRLPFRYREAKHACFLAQIGQDTWHVKLNTARPPQGEVRVVPPATFRPPGNIPSPESGKWRLLWVNPQLMGYHTQDEVRNSALARKGATFDFAHQLIRLGCCASYCGDGDRRA